MVPNPVILLHVANLIMSFLAHLELRPKISSYFAFYNETDRKLIMRFAACNKITGLRNYISNSLQLLTVTKE